MIFVRRDAKLIPRKLLKKASAAQRELELMAPEKRAQFIQSKADIWRAFKKYLSMMSHGKCWYSESPPDQSVMDVDHYRPKLAARRSETETDDGYEWLAFSWDNFVLAAQRSNRLSTNEETHATEGKSSWFPLLAQSPVATWDNRCVDKERPVLLDPTRREDVQLVEVMADGRIGPSPYCLGTNKKRVQQSTKLLGLDLPLLKAARLRVMRDINQSCEVLLRMMEEANKSTNFADKAPLNSVIDALKGKTHPMEPYSAAARAQLRLRGFGDLCVQIEEGDLR